MELNQLWPKADYITVHTPLIPQTKGRWGSKVILVKVSVRGKITILHNLRFLNSLKDLKTIFRYKKLHKKILFLLKVITQKIFFAYQLFN